MPISGNTIKEIDEAKEVEDLKKLEAVLFISGRFLTLQELISYTDINPILIRELIEKLREKYQENYSAIEIISKGTDKEMWKMSVSQEYGELINRLATGRSEFTKAEQETLAIIAYKQPIKQSVVIKIRGNKAYDHIKKFIDLGFLRRKRAGHTWELSLSDEFHDYFGSEAKTIEVENENKDKESGVK